MAFIWVRLSGRILSFENVFHFEFVRDGSLSIDVTLSFFLSAEVAQLLTRNVNYEVPALKKQINKCQQLQTVSALSAFICNVHLRTMRNWTLGITKILTPF